jgi:hypothetical protein
VLDKIPSLLLAITIPYIVGIAFIGISLLLSVVERIQPPTRYRKTCLAKIVVIVLAGLALLTGNVITTYIAKSLAKKINDFGQHIGLSASSSQRFLIITWISFGFSVMIAAYWTYEFHLNKRTGRVGYHSKQWQGYS